MDKTPCRINIEKRATTNSYYRNVMWTSPQLQLVVMCLLRNERVPMETHPHTSQFIRVEQGKLNARVGKHRYRLRDGDCLIVPPGQPHELWNPGLHPCRFYTLYGPKEHAPNHTDIRQPREKF